MYAKCIKRCLDFILSLAAIILLSPILLIVMIINSIVMKGNPFFTQQRPGRRPRKRNSDGTYTFGEEKIFKLIKFRSMTNARDKKTGELLPDNQRLTKWGKIIRKTSIDELPELFNILAGDMAIVGPRPLLVKYLPRYSEEQRHRHDVRQGLTGWAQVNGRNAISWEERFEKDVWYTRNISFLLDMKILIMTVAKVFNRNGISSSTSVTMEEFMGTGSDT